MRVHSVQNSNSTIRPVILAASRQRRLWPLSTPETPFFLRSINGRPALLVRTLQALEAIPEFGVPIIILGETAARLGISEITRIRPDATIFLMPDGIGSGISSVLGAIEVSNKSASGQMALIPANFYASDPVEAFRSMASVASQCSEGDQVVLMTRRSSSPATNLSVELGARVAGTALYHLNQLHHLISDETASVLRETNSLLNYSGPALAMTQSLLRHVQSTFPTTYVACHNALKLAEKYGNTYRPQSDFLSFAGRPVIRDYFQSVLPSLQAYIGNPDWRTIETFRDPFFDDFTSHPITPVACAGIENCKIIASNDGVLILRHGHENEVKDHYPNSTTAHGSGTKLSQKGPSLRFTA